MCEVINHVLPNTVFYTNMCTVWSHKPCATSIQYSIHMCTVWSHKPCATWYNVLNTHVLCEVIRILYQVPCATQYNVLYTCVLCEVINHVLLNTMFYTHVNTMCEVIQPCATVIQCHKCTCATQYNVKSYTMCYLIQCSVHTCTVWSHKSCATQYNVLYKHVYCVKSQIMCYPIQCSIQTCVLCEVINHVLLNTMLLYTCVLCEVMCKPCATWYNTMFYTNMCTVWSHKSCATQYNVLYKHVYCVKSQIMCYSIQCSIQTCVLCEVTNHVLPNTSCATQYNVLYKHVLCEVTNHVLPNTMFYTRVYCVKS